MSSTPSLIALFLALLIPYALAGMELNNLIIAIEHKDNDRVKELLKQKVDPNCSIKSLTANIQKLPFLLNIATVCHNEEAVCLLLDAGADPLKKHVTAYTPTPMGSKPILHDGIPTMALRHSPAMAELLLSHVPLPLIRSRWNTSGITLLLCFKRIMDYLPRDVRLLLCNYFVVAQVVPEQHTKAIEMCKVINAQNPNHKKTDSEYKEKFDPDNLQYLYPKWAACIHKTLQNRPVKESNKKE